MKERPILFSGPMVRAILDGRKTQTRRVMKNPPTQSAKFPWLGVKQHYAKGQWIYPNALPQILAESPYGQPGDRLWVRETWGVGSRPDPWGGYDGIEYRADEEWLEENDDFPCYKVQTPDGVELIDYMGGWKPSIHMPRWASRILLEIVSVRVERLNDISEADAEAEGCAQAGIETGQVLETSAPVEIGSYAAAFCDLWESINGTGSWGDNPYVWAIEFRRIEQ